MAGNLADNLAAVLGQLLEPRTGLTGEGGDAGVLQTHGVDHAAGDLGHAGRRVAKGTGCGIDGVLHLDAAEIDGHVHGTH